MGDLPRKILPQALTSSRGVTLGFGLVGDIQLGCRHVSERCTARIVGILCILFRKNNLGLVRGLSSNFSGGRSLTPPCEKMRSGAGKMAMTRTARGILCQPASRYDLQFPRPIVNR